MRPEAVVPDPELELVLLPELLEDDELDELDEELELLELEELLELDELLELEEIDPPPESGPPHAASRSCAPIRDNMMRPGRGHKLEGRARAESDFMILSLRFRTPWRCARIGA
jgi:hypothetical protein